MYVCTSFAPKQPTLLTEQPLYFPSTIPLSLLSQSSPFSFSCCPFSTSLTPYFLSLTNQLPLFLCFPKNDVQLSEKCVMYNFQNYDKCDHVFWALLLFSF
uniref:Uncharacterized protein n=1 Tax=Cacopsylla melanoneura TaxID=428564 RepID=A0A8D8ZU74_9HEMI